MDEGHVLETEPSNLSHRLSYLKGVCAAGRSGGADNVMMEVVDALSEAVDRVAELERRLEDVEQYVEDMDEDLGSMEEALFESLDNSEDFADHLEDDTNPLVVSFADIPCPYCGVHFFLDRDFWTDESVVDINCPSCNERVAVSSGLLDAGESH